KRVPARLVDKPEKTAEDERELEVFQTLLALLRVMGNQACARELNRRGSFRHYRYSHYEQGWRRWRANDVQRLRQNPLLYGLVELRISDRRFRKKLSQEQARHGECTTEAEGLFQRIVPELAYMSKEAWDQL